MSDSLLSWAVTLICPAVPRGDGLVTLRAAQLRNIEQQHSFKQYSWRPEIHLALSTTHSRILARHCPSSLKNQPRAEDGGDGGEELPLRAALRRPDGDGAVAAVGVAEAGRGRPQRPAADLVVLALLLFVAAPRYLWKASRRSHQLFSELSLSFNSTFYTG